MHDHPSSVKGGGQNKKNRLEGHEENKTQGDFEPGKK